MKIFSIETSCDETAGAVVENGIREICSVVASSKDFHEKTGGVVPEIAARKQVEFITPVISQTLKEASIEPSDIDYLAVTTGPGLIGSLLVGIEAVKSLSLAWDKPIIPVNHLVGHIYANFIDSLKEVIFPALVLLVSGGHTDLVLMKDHGSFMFLGGTLDDAAGEAFDKTARLLGISRYLGGALLSKKASECQENTIKQTLPRPMINKDNYDFSFSGLKTAVKRLVETKDLPIELVSKEFEEAVVDVLVSKSIKAAKEYNVKSILLGGGVSANKPLRERVSIEVAKLNIDVHIPPIRLCTDNAVYIASAAYFNRNVKPISEIEAIPSLGIMDKP